MNFDTDKLKIIDCRLCEIANKRKTIVSGTGSKTSDLFIIGEAPGYTEDVNGIPFTGESGKLLDKIISFTGIAKKECYLTNVVKCKTPNNRKPYVQEIANCSQSLMMELYLVNPKIIVLLGSTALQTYFGNKSLKIGRERGRIIVQKVRNTTRFVIPIFHPSYLLYNDSDTVKSQFAKDFKKVAILYRILVNPLINIRL